MKVWIPTEEEIEIMTKEGIKKFWSARKDSASVREGKTLDGIVDLLKEILIKNDITEEEIHIVKGAVTLPGYFRPTKQWDIVVVRELDNNQKQLIAAIELKSQIGSLGNNFNNRTEEAMGSSLDILTAYREGAFGLPKPWLGYLVLLEGSEESIKPRKVKSKHFEVFKEFKDDPSFAKRYEIFCEKLMREGLYDSCCLILADKYRTEEGIFTETTPSLSMDAFIRSLVGHLISFK